MKRQHTYEQLIGQKLNAVPAPDVTGRWEQVEAMLDKALPQDGQAALPCVLAESRSADNGQHESWL